MRFKLNSTVPLRALWGGVFSAILFRGDGVFRCRTAGHRFGRFFRRHDHAGCRLG